jgi:tight adherence protein B
MSLLIVYAFVFAAVLLAADTLLRRLLGQRAARQEVNERLARLSKGGDHHDTYQSLLKDRSLAKAGGQGDLVSRFRQLYAQTGLTLQGRQKVLYVVVILVVSFGISVLATPLFLLRLVLTLALSAALLLLALQYLRLRRVRKFVQQLPAALDIIVRSLHAGHPLNAAVALVGREMPDPIGSEFGILTDQLTFGSEFDEAFYNLFGRVGADELNLLAVTVSVQRNTGGNLSEVLENLASMIRDRLMLKNKIKAISAEGRFTAVLMSVFPGVLYLIISTLAPDYFDPIWETGRGTLIVVGTILYMSIGVYIMNRMVRFDF